MATTRRISWLMLSALAMTSVIAGQSTINNTLSYAPGAVASGGTQPTSSIGTGGFVNGQNAATLVPEEIFRNTASSAADRGMLVGDVTTGGSYTGTTTTTLSAATTSDGNDSTGVSAATTTPIVLAIAAACAVAIAAIGIIKKRSNMRVPSPRTPVDKTIYYMVEAEKPRIFQVTRQLTPPV